MIHAFIKKGSFQDSVSLMLISRRLSESDAVDEVSVMMGTPANKTLLKATGFWHPHFTDATPNDICVAIRCEHRQDSITDSVRQQLEQALNTVSQGNGNGQALPTARRWQSACEKLPDANLTLISVAGEYAAELAERALERQQNVMIFSDNVSLEQEVALKQRARARQLLVMGPDCGTAVVAGVPLAFSNALPTGSIGIVGASGTGIQELASQIALMGQGITHALGLGGRDLSAEVGGISALTALEMLAGDPHSKVIAFVSKPPAAVVRQTVLTAMKAIGKPVVALFLGSSPPLRRDGNVYLASTLAEAARLAVMLANVAAVASTQPKVIERKIIGLFTGGTLAAEAAMILGEHLDAKSDQRHTQGIMFQAAGHQLIDLGDDVYTVGKPHPMIDPTARHQQILALAERPEIGVLLLDVVLGYGSHADPAGMAANAVTELRARRGTSTPLVAIATITGTEQDPQQRSVQLNTLLNAGIVVMNNLEEAVLLALQLITPGPGDGFAPLHALLQDARVINVGLRSFADELQANGCPVVHYQWSPVAGGNAQLANLLKQLD
ncbi:acyl-CoA synthetase FdrA [Serratia sp. AKBS12]|uniref:acyl-CoA synthetase FdrA n=1 Tax=Serratia sp. AKBS12 TaxID=2974597 RepID=UPI002166B830|nr:acyl-CoA synthetase FdrA [Serratia sp. AKBS12]MCS3409729.1 acyl-CoA synthetase FdrA [Serratia sp. AKBS12]